MVDAARRIAGILRSLEGSADVKVEEAVGLPFLEIRIDKAEIARLGLSHFAVQDVIGAAIGGRDIRFRRFSYPGRPRTAGDVAAQGHCLFALEHGAGSLTKSESAVLPAGDQDAARKQLPHDAAPVLVGQVRPDAIGREALMTQLTDALSVGAAQDAAGD